MKYLIALLLFCGVVFSTASVSKAEELTLSEFMKEIIIDPPIENMLEFDLFCMANQHSRDYEQVLRLDEDQIFLMALNDTYVVIWMEGWKFIIHVIAHDYNRYKLYAYCETEPLINLKYKERYTLPFYWHEKLLRKIAEGDK